MRFFAIFHAVCAGFSLRGLVQALADDRGAAVAAMLTFALCLNLAAAVWRVHQVRP